MEQDAAAFDRVVQHRRSVRVFDDTEVPPEVIERSLQRAILSPNSSNLQLWEFYWVRDPEAKARMKDICLGQNAAKTATELVVFVVRRDLWKQRCAAVLDAQIAAFRGPEGKPLSKAQKKVLVYWQKVIPLLYTSGGGLLDAGKWAFAKARGLKSPTPREVTHQQTVVSAHRSVALSAMTFMYSIAAEGFDSCPMEGHDSARVKRLLGLPRGAEISMVIAVGKRGKKGVYGPRLRIPYEDVVFEV